MQTPENLYDLNDETAVIGAFMFRDDSAEAIETVSILKPDEFYLAAHRNIWAVICKLVTANQKADWMSVDSALRDRGDTQAANLVMQAANTTPSQVSMVQKARRIKKFAQLRAAMSALHEAMDKLSSIGDPDERLKSALNSLSSVGDEQDENDIKTSLEVMSDVYKLMEEAVSREDGLIGISSGFEEIDRMTNGFQPSDLIIVAAPPSMGKELINSALVYMMDGTSKQIGEIMKGDKLASIDGKPSSVVGVYPQGVKDIYQVTFSDGRSVIAGIEHQWEVNHKDWKEPRILTTADVMALMGKETNKNRLCIPYCNGEFGEDVGLTIDPYLLGALIGDGGLSQTGVRFSNPDDFILDAIRPMVGNLEIKYVSGCDYAITSKRGKGNWLIKELKKFDLFGKRSHEKHIPSNYLSASRASRVRLINGLMDTDGTVEKHGTMTYTTTSKQLANDFLALARSLGYWAKEKSRITSYTHNGEKRQGKRSYTVTIQGEGMEELVTLPRKKERLLARRSGRKMNLTFSSIEKIGREECTCIMVDHERSLFLTDDYIVTHNTTLTLNFGEHAAFLAKEKKKVLFFSLEMSAAQLMQKTMANLGNIYLKKIRTGDALKDHYGMAGLTRAAELITASADNFMIDDKGGQTVTEMHARAKRAQMRMGGLDLIIVDYLHKIEAEGESEVMQVRAKVRGMKNLAKKLKCPVICLSQLNRGLVGRPEMKNLLGSSAIEQESDVIMFIYDEDYQGERGINSLSEIIFAKNRMGETGSVYLQPELAMSRFSSTNRLPQPKEELKKFAKREFK